MSQILVVLLSGVSAAVVSTLGSIILNRLNRHDTEEDRAQKSDEDMHKKIDAISRGLMYLELDKIKYLGFKYISEGEVDYDDRRLLHKMHDNYHNDLGGNGDLDAVMAGVDKLPLKATRDSRE
jgi:hypothetical protein